MLFKMYSMMNHLTAGSHISTKLTRQEYRNTEKLSQLQPLTDQRKYAASNAKYYFTSTPQFFVINGTPKSHSVESC